MENNLRKDGMSYILGIQTLLFGLFLQFHENFMETKGPYQLFTNPFDDFWITAVLITVGGMYILSVQFRWKSKKIWLSVMQFLWMAFFVAFFLRELSGVSNSGWVLTFGLNLSILYEAYRGDFN